MPNRKSSSMLALTCLLATMGCDDKSTSAPEALVGFGNEPAWQVEIDREGMILHEDYGQEITRFPFEAPRRVVGGWEYTTTADTGEILRIAVRERECQDTMADATYPYSVTVLNEDHEYRGCGRIRK